MGKTNTNVTVNFWLLTIFLALVLGGTSLGVLYMARANSIVKTKILANKEAARPANIEAIIIADKNCPECFDVAPMLASLSKLNIKLTSSRTIDRIDEGAKTLIANYAITKLPTLILKGEVQKDANLKNALSRAGDVNGDTFVLRQIGGPYVVAASGEIKGKTELTLIGDLSCPNCYDVRQHQLILSQFGLKTDKVKNLDIGSAEAKTLINKYKISFVPTFILSGEVKEYPALVKVWPQVGVVENGDYVFTLGVPSMGTYKNLKTGKIVDPATTKVSAGATAGKK